MERELLTVDDICKWLKVTRRTIERWRKRGMPFVKVGRLVRFEKKAVEDWINETNEK